MRDVAQGTIVLNANKLIMIFFNYMPFTEDMITLHFNKSEIWIPVNLRMRCIKFYWNLSSDSVEKHPTRETFSNWQTDRPWKKKLSKKVAWTHVSYKLSILDPIIFKLYMLWVIFTVTVFLVNFSVNKPLEYTYILLQKRWLITIRHSFLRLFYIMTSLGW